LPYHLNSKRLGEIVPYNHHIPKRWFDSSMWSRWNHSLLSKTAKESVLCMFLAAHRLGEKKSLSLPFLPPELVLIILGHVPSRFLGKFA
jgi:hypothetical protein